MTETKTYKNVVVVVRIIDPKTEKIESKQIKNIDGKDRRAWLTSVVMWAAMNGKIAEVINLEDDKKHGSS